MATHVISRQAGAGTPGVDTEGAVGATFAVTAAGEVATYDITTTKALTLSLSDGTSKGYRHIIEVWVRQGATGYAVTLPTGVKWASGTAPTIATTANSISILRFMTVDGGATWAGELVAGAALS
jgi:hypothetical protein